MIGEIQAQHFAFVIGLVAIANWLFGDRSILGHQLLMRNGLLFRLFRYVGLGLFVAAWFLRDSLQPKPLVWFAAYAGAGLMLIGTAKRRESSTRVEDVGDPRSNAED